MTFLASVATSENDHGYEAGRAVATDAHAAFVAPPSLMIAAISTTYHRPEEVVHGIRSKSSAPLVGLFTPGVLTMAGPLSKGVGLLVFQTGSMPFGLALDQSPYHQDTPIATSPTAPPHTVLLLAGTAPNIATGSDSSVLVGARAPMSVFLNDQTRSDAGVIVTFPPSLTIGIGLAQLSGSSSIDTVAAAAHDACTTLHTPPRAALVFQTDESRTALTSRHAPEWEQIREVLGHTLPILGFHVPTLIVPANTGHSQLLVLTIGMA